MRFGQRVRHLASAAITAVTAGPLSTVLSPRKVRDPCAWFPTAGSASCAWHRHVAHRGPLYQKRHASA